MITQNGYLWVKPIEEESTFKVEEENYCFVELLEDWFGNRALKQAIRFKKGTKLIVKNLELYCVKQEKHYFVHESNVVAIYD